MSGFNFPTQSPLFYVNNRERYQRQEWIKKIEKFTGRRLIVYVANLNAVNNSISRNDVLPFNEIITDLDEQEKVDLILHTPGGDPNATEQLVNSLIPRISNLRVIVPLTSKSAGTMFSLVADEILMSDASELGPIDPQIIVTNATGGQAMRPAKAFLKGLNTIQAEVEKSGSLNPAYFPILQSIDAAQIQFCHQAVSHAEIIAKKWLSRSMCKGDENKASEIAKHLLDIEKYPHHGNVINWSEAQQLGLNVTYIDPKDELWRAFSSLMALYDYDMKQLELSKIFEGNKISVTI